MVGGQGAAGRTPAELSAAELAGAELSAAELADAELTEAELADAELAREMRAAYGKAAAGWAAGPGQVYGPLARALLVASPVPLAGSRVLDLGAGTGVAGRAALAAGADRVVAADLALAMLRLITPPEHPVVADAVALPFRDQAFDLVVAAFCLNHLDRPGDALREIRRVGHGLAASMFAPGWTHPAKQAVREALRPFGYQPPAWYESMTGESGSLAGDSGPASRDPARLADQAAGAGFSDVRVRTISVRTGLSAPAELASWRLGLAHVAPFLQSLDAPRRAAARRAAEQAVAGTGPLVASMFVLTAR
jgi:SAM-dependent methyltransferase